MRAVAVDGRAAASAAFPSWGPSPAERLLRNRRRAWRRTRYLGGPQRPQQHRRVWVRGKRIAVFDTVGDPQGRATVFASLPPELGRVLSVGRLDLSSEGLLLLTNDGGLSRVLERSDWLRRYRVRVYGRPDAARLAALAKGVTVEGVRYGPITAKIDSTTGSNAWLSLGLSEGKNREVRRVLEHLGLLVNRLIRTAYGPFQLGSLKRGQVARIPPKVVREQLVGNDAHRRR